MDVFVAMEHDLDQLDRQETGIIGVFADEPDARAAVADYRREFGGSNQRVWVKNHTIESDWVRPDWMDHPREEAV